MDIKTLPASLHYGKVWRNIEAIMFSSRDIYVCKFPCVITHNALCVTCALVTVVHGNLASNSHGDTF